MAKNSNCAYTIVYVFGPTRCKENYLNDKLLKRENGEFVKIGKTDFNGNFDNISEEKLKNTAIERCAQESKTGISDWCSIYDVFIFPQTKGKNIDDIIRNLLCNDIYSLENSKDEIKEKQEGDIKPGKEFVYGVCRNHIKHAIESYCFQLVINSSEESLKSIQTICKYNAIISNDDEDTEEQMTFHARSSRTNRDISVILCPGDVVYLTDSRNKNAPVLQGNQQIQAQYIGNKKFQFENRPDAFSSRLALDLINEFCKTNYDTINGNDCWMVEYEEDGTIKRDTLSNRYDSFIDANKIQK